MVRSPKYTQTKKKQGSEGAIYQCVTPSIPPVPVCNLLSSQSTKLIGSSDLLCMLQGHSG